MPTSEPPNRDRQDPRPVGDFFAPFFRVAFRSIDASPGLVSSASAASAAAAAATGTPAAATLEALALNLQAAVAATEAANFAAFANDPEFEMTIDSRNLAYYASSLSIDFKGGAPGEFTLMLTPPYEEALKLIDNRLIQYGSLVKVQWGYSSAMSSKTVLSPIHIFVCNRPQLAMTANDITITIIGNDVMADPCMRNQTREQWLRTQYATDLSIIEAIARRQGGLRVDATNVPADSLLRQTKTEPAAQSDTDWRFARDLCWDNLVSMQVEAGVVRLYDTRTVTTQPAAYNLLWRRAPTTDRDIPLMTFTGNSDMRAFLPPEAVSVLDISVNTNTNNPAARNFSGPALANNPHIGAQPNDASAAGRDGNTGRTTTDTQSGANIITRPRQRAIDAGVVLPRPVHVNNADTIAERLAREAEFWANTKAVATAPGFPDVLPLMVVQVEGAGRSFSGPYFIQGARHDLSTDGYTMTLELIRNTDPISDGQQPLSPPTSPQVGDGTETPRSAE